MSNAILSPKSDLDDRISAFKAGQVRTKLHDDILCNAKILVIDDEPVIIGVVRKYLKEAGCDNVVATSDASGAIEAIRGEQPDLVLLDIVMPEANGLEILESIRSEQAIKDIPVVMLTVASDLQTRLVAFELGANDFLAKPVDAHELVLRIGNVLAARAHQEQASESPLDRDARYAVSDNGLLDAFLEWTVDGERKQVSADIRDLSRHGVKLSASAELPVGTVVELKLLACVLQFELSISAEVRWSRPQSEIRNMIGCFFLVELPSDTLSTLSSAECLERRLDTRKPVSLAATVKKEMQGGDAHWLEIVDYTAGGVRLFCCEPKTLGKRLLLEVPDGEDSSICIPVRALWQRQVEGGFHVGCSFLNNSGYGAIQRASENCLGDYQPKRSFQKATARPRLRLSTVWWMGLAAILSWFAIRAIDFWAQ